jgi:proline iminopeptidase
MTVAEAPAYRTLYPAIEPYQTGMLPVDNGHTLYWERVGTPGAKPAVMLHGGPGGGCSPDHRRQWDPARYDVLLFDQRGCSRSTPFADLTANTTWDLVADIERLREMCGHAAWQVFGGSWGSTLSLAYAQAHPGRVTELILRGIFLCDQRELDWLYEYGASEIYPEEWERFVAHAERHGGGDLLETYIALLDDADPTVRRAAASAWNRWEAVTVTLLPQPDTIDQMADGDNAVATARIETHYFKHDCWLEPGQLLRDAARLHAIPGVIVQGRHDSCTPPSAAWALKQAWPQVDLQIVPDGGHLFSEPGITDGLVRATDRFADASG